METIMSYIENLFRSYPDTPEVQKAREDLTGIMEDKYQELKQLGKTENEAIGIVISEFGNMDELAEELGLQGRGSWSDTSASRESAATENAYKEPEHYISRAEAETFVKTSVSAGRKIGLGVAICILSVFPGGICEALVTGGMLTEPISEAISGTVLFFMITIAVAIFISAAFKIQKYDEWKKNFIQLDSATKQKLDAENEAYTPTFARMIITGVTCCILSIVPGAIAEGVFTSAADVWKAELIETLLFIFVAIGVFLFIQAGMRRSAYEKLLNKGDYSPEKKAEAKKSIIGAIAAIYWPVTVAIYLLWSFIGHAWFISWIIWPVAGVIFGGIAAVTAIIQEKN